MFLTLEILEKYNACDEGKKWFMRHFPLGAELIDVMRDKTVTPEFLHWGYDNLPSCSLRERDYYWKKLKVEFDSRATCYHVDNITNSFWVSKSSHVSNSSHIFQSKEVKNSTNVLHGDVVVDSSFIYSGEFIYSSQRVLHCSNVTDSHDIVCSSYVVNSHSVINSFNIHNSAYVSSYVEGSTCQVRDSRFIVGCRNIKHCLFCTNIQDADYMLFNQPIEPSDYEIIMRQLDNLLDGWDMELVKNNEWPGNTIPFDTPNIQHHLRKRWDTIPEKFWRWVRTLPGYDPMIIFELTLNSEKV